VSAGSPPGGSVRVRPLVRPRWHRSRIIQQIAALPSSIIKEIANAAANTTVRYRGMVVFRTIPPRFSGGSWHAICDAFGVPATTPRAG